MNKNRKLYQPKVELKLNCEFEQKENNISLDDERIQNLLFYNDDFESKLKKLESQNPQTFKALCRRNDNNDRFFYCFYHGIRFQNYLEKLESIFKDRAILAGNYQENYYLYDDNCNEGEYISLLSGFDGYNLVYKTFIMENISLIVSLDCNAIKTIYLPYEEWEQLKGRNTKNRYSYCQGEYQVKKIIPIEMVKAIGIPAKYLKLTNKEYLIETYQNDILYLMNKYNIYLPIIDTSDYNKILFIQKENNLSCHTYKKLNLVKD